MRELARRFYDEHFAGREFQWWGEKMLDPRVAYDLQEHFEGTRYVLLVRDPRDVLCSRRSYAARRLERFEEDPVAATIADPEQRARERERLAHLAAWPAAEHAGVWHGVYEDVGPRLRDTLVVRYEDFVDDPVREVGRILGHLGLEPDDAVDRALATDGGVERHGTAGSVDRSVGRWRSDLDAADVEEVERRCAAGMARYGYAPSGGG